MAKVSWADLEGLVENKVRENRNLEFKRDLPSRTPADRREFLKDIAALANSGGGDLIFGIEEQAHRACLVVGVSPDQRSSVVLALEQSLDAGLSPRVVRQARWIDSDDGRAALLFRVPASMIGPHRREEDGRFYGRNSEGTYQMDVMELRQAFLGAEAIPRRIARWREERLAAIRANQASIPIQGKRQLVVHVVPLDSFTGCPNLPVAELLDRPESLIPRYGGGYFRRLNFDGYLTYLSTGTTETYYQLHRNGPIEMLDTAVVEPRGHDVGAQSKIHADWLEKTTMEAVSQFIGLQGSLGLRGPFYVMISLLGLRGGRLVTPGNHRLGFELERAELHLPEFMVDSEPELTAATFRPTWDLLWQSFGVPNDPHFDRDGEWRGEALVFFNQRVIGGRVG